MLNLIKAEIYKYLRRPYYYIFNLIMIIMIVLVGCTIKFILMPAGINADLTEPMSLMILNNAMVLFAFIDIMSEENRMKTMKNLATSNLKRSSIFIGKTIVQIIIVIVSLTVYMFTIIAVSYILNIVPDGGINDIFKFGYRYMVAIPVYIGCLVFYNTIVICFDNELIGTLVLFIIVIGLPIGTDYLSEYLGGIFTFLNKYLLMNLLAYVQNMAFVFKNIMICILAGIVNIAILIPIGIYTFNKKEIR